MHVSNIRHAPVLALAFALAAAPAAAQVDEVLDSTGDGVHPLDGPSGVAVGPAGEVYVAGRESDNVLRIAPDGTVTQVLDASGDGAGNPLDGPRALVVDPSGNLFVAASGSLLEGRVFRVTPQGAVTQVLGPEGDGDGHVPAFIQDLAVGPAGTLYVPSSNAFAAESYVFAVEPDGTVELLLDETGDGAGNGLVQPWGVAVDAAGAVYVTGQFSGNVLRVDPDGTVTEVLDGFDLGPEIGVFLPADVEVDAQGNVLVVSSAAIVLVADVFRLAPDGSVERIFDVNADGGGEIALGILDLAVDGAGSAYVAGQTSNNAFEITSAGAVVKLLDATGAGAGATLSLPAGLATDGGGNLYVAGNGSDNLFRIGPLAACTFRNGSGANPADFTCLTEPVLGSVWQTAIDPTPSAGDTTLATVLVLAHGGPVQGLFAPEGELLVLPPYRFFANLAGAVGQHAIPIPADPVYAGLALNAQGVRLEVQGGVLPLAVLLNAQDPRLGF